MRLKTLEWYLESSGRQMNYSVRFPRCLFGLHKTSLSSIWKQSEEWLNAPSYFWVFLECSGRVKLLMLLTPGKVMAWKKTVIYQCPMVVAPNKARWCVSPMAFIGRGDSMKSHGKRCVLRRMCLWVCCRHLNSYRQAWCRARNRSVTEVEFRRNELHKASHSWYRETWL